MIFVKKLLTFFIVCLSLATQSANAAAGAEQSRDFVQSLGDKVIEIVANASLSQENKEQKLNSLFIESVDIDWIAKFVVGRFWRESSADQQQQYQAAYKKFLVSSYVSKFRKYTDQKMAINKFIVEAEGEYLVETSINDQDGKSYKVDYKLRQTSDGKFRIYDIIAEGVSMITTQRSEFGSILAREGMTSLIAKLGQKS